MRWMVLEYIEQTPKNKSSDPFEFPVRFYTDNGSFDERYFRKIGEANTRKEAQSIIWKDNPEILKQLNLL